jgi:hypothetical protein
LRTYEDFCQAFPRLKSNIIDCNINFQIPETLIIGKKFYNYQMPHEELDQIAKNYVNKILEFKKNKNFTNVKKIIVIGQVPEFYSSYGDLISCYTRPFYINKKICDNYYNSEIFDIEKDIIKMTQNLNSKETLNKSLKKYINRIKSDDTKYYFFDPFDYLCKKEKCLQVQDGNMVYNDATHLSIFGSNFLIKNIETNLVDIIVKQK